MKLLALYLLAFGLNVSATGFSQTITLNEKSISYQQLFRLIHKQTGYQVFYKSNLLDGNERLQLNVNQLPVEKVLTLALKSKPLTYSIVDKSIVIKEAPPTRAALVPEVLATVKGVVKDAEGHPLPGVSITITGTSKGTTTDENGRFTIDVKPGETLQLSRVGYISATIKPGAQTSLTVTMELAHALIDEVIVVGYGTQKKTNLTGAVSTITAKRLKDRPITNLATGLQGVSPGLIITRTNGEPGREGINIQIRGFTSANGNVDPLVVIDGISTSIDALTRINPNDVENITVLKDAASAAIYGSQSSGGVIVITTKKASLGKTTFNASALYSLKRPINLPDRMSLLEEALFVNQAYVNSINQPYREYSESDLKNIRNNVLFARDDANPTSRNLEYFNQVPAEDILTQKYAPSQTYDLSLSGGTEKLNYVLSGGLLNEEGLLKIGRDEARRYNGRLKVNSKLTRHILLEAGLAYANKYYDAPPESLGGDYSTLYTITRFRLRNPLYTPNGNYKEELIADLAEGGFQKFKESRFDANAALSINDLVKGLTLKAIIGSQYRVDNDQTFRRSVQLYATDTNMVDYPTRMSNVPNSYYEFSGTYNRSNIQYLATYNTEIGEKNDLSAFAGYEFQDFKYTWINASANNLFNNDIAAVVHSDQVNRNNSQGYDAFAFQSVFAKLNYTYDKRFVVEGTFRRDQSSKLAPGRQAQNFGAVSGAWNIANEKWFVVPAISDAKLRASWGRLGGALGDNFPAFSWANTLERRSGLILGSTNNPYYYQGAIPSNLITWENIEMTNYGIDLAFLKNKLTLTAEYFVKWNKNMATTVPLPATLGVGAPKKNIGQLKVWGWEVEMAYRSTIGKDWNVNVGFNISDNQNKLVKFSKNESVAVGKVQFLEGYPLNTFWGYKTDGYYASQDEAAKAPKLTGNSKLVGAGDVKYLDLNGDGEINRGKGTLEDYGDLVLIGTDAPRYSYGVTLGVEYKNFDFTMFLQGVGKRNFLPNYLYLSPLGESWRMPMKIHLDYWTPENQDALFPRPFAQGDQNYQASDKWVFNAAYMRIKNLQLGYTLPQNITKRFACQRLRIFFTSQDLLTFTNMKGFETVYDPESRNGTINDYPYFTTMSFGVNVGF